MAVKLNYRAWFNPHALFIKLVTLFCFVTKLSFSQNFILNLNLNNCSNCNANIYLLKEYFNNQNLNIILPVKFKGDSLMTACIQSTVSIIRNLPLLYLMIIKCLFQKLDFLN